MEKSNKGYDTKAGTLVESVNSGTKRMMMGIPMTGLLRSEWVLARYGQIIPCNWGMIEFFQFVDQWSPLKYSVADARNIIACAAVEGNYEWLLFIDHDVVLPPKTILYMNEQIHKNDIPVYAGLYFTQSVPSEPLIYRGRGNSHYKDWNLGDKVWVDGVPMGCTLINVRLLKAMYDESDEYMAGQTKTRRIFITPRASYYDPEKRGWFNSQGTEDLEWCTRIMDGGFFEKAGWPEYQKKKYPFMIDTAIFCKHIDWNGVQYPKNGEEAEFVKKEDLVPDRELMKAGVI